MTEEQIDSSTSSSISEAIRKAAQRYLLDYGPVNRAGVNRMVDDLHAGKATLRGGMTVEQAMDVINLIAVVCYKADPERYEADNHLLSTAGKEQ